MQEEIIDIQDSQVRSSVETVINILKDIEVNEEIMQYILEQVGMEDASMAMSIDLAWKRKC